MSDEKNILHCPCGDPHVKRDISLWHQMERMTEAHGPNILVTVQGQGAWSVPRIWIHFHGLEAHQVAALADWYGWAAFESEGT